MEAVLQTRAQQITIEDKKITYLTLLFQANSFR